VPAPTLSPRDLSRATLARQMLLAREACDPVDAVERLAGLQAQLARPPFVGLWSRLAGFAREHLLAPIHARRLVRATMMRATIHLVSARDFVRFRAALQPAIAASVASILARVEQLDLERLVQVGRELLDERPRAFDELRPLLAARGLAGDERALGYAVRMFVPLVQVPNETAPWGWDAKAAFAVAESWLGAPMSLGGTETRELVLRYLAAFGPASVADAATWSGLRGLRETFEALRRELAVFRDERGRELFDLPDAPRPSPDDVEVPLRFLPDFDNLVLAHADRTRVVPEAHRSRMMSRNLQVAATVLVDGFVAGTWRVERARGAAVLAVRPFGKPTRAVRRALEEEGLALLRFAEPQARGYELRVDQDA